MINDTLTFRLEGLATDQGLVKADVFLKKLGQLLKGLKAADLSVNKEETYEYIITDLKIGSAYAALREKKKIRKNHTFSSIDEYGRALNVIRDGAKSAQFLPSALINSVKSLTGDVDKKILGGEISTNDNSVIPLDKYMNRQATEIKKSNEYSIKSLENACFKGVSFASFEGRLQLLDTRSTESESKLIRAKLITSIGHKELDCYITREKNPDFLDFFEKNIKVSGLARYSGKHYFPAQFDIKKFELITSAHTFQNWRGAFKDANYFELEESWNSHV